MKKIEVYEASDGVRFDSEKECLAYEDKKDLENLERQYKFYRDKWEKHWEAKSDKLMNDIGTCISEVLKSRSIDEMTTVLQSVEIWLYSHGVNLKKYDVTIDDKGDNHWTEHWP